MWPIYMWPRRKGRIFTSRCTYIYIYMTDINQRSSQSHTRARRSRIPAQPQRAANPASRSAAGLGGNDVADLSLCLHESSGRL